MWFEIIFCFFLILFLSPIKIEFGVYINLLENKGAVFFKICGVVFTQEKFVVSDGEVTAKNNREKQKTIQLSQNDKDIIFLKILINSIFRKTILDKIDFFFDMGKKDDAFISTMATGFVQVVMNIILNILRTKKSGFISGIYCNALYQTNKLTSTFFISCWTNLFDLSFSFIKSKLKANFRVKKLKTN